jgi:hypothetical protein
MDLDSRFDALQEQTGPLERLIRIFAATLEKPTLHDYPDGHGFRYASPDVRHFCLVKVTRALSDYNACIELAKKGYAQQVCVLVRTMGRVFEACRVRDRTVCVRRTQN